jgi:hypothetical protein
MNRKRIEQMVRLLPANASIFTNGRPVGGQPPRLAERLATAVNNPGFCHCFVLEFVARDEALPASVHEQCLRRAFNHYAGRNVIEDQVMLRVEELTLLMSQFTREVLNALLVAKDATYAQIAERLSLKVEVAKMYEQLHFNVRDRLAEKAYIAGIVFPAGRMQMLKADAAVDLPLETQLLQAGLIHGAEQVLWLAGITPEQTDSPVAEKYLKDFEQELIANAIHLARGGHLNCKTAPGINHAKSLLTANRNAVAPPRSQGDDEMGLGAVGMTPGESIMATVERLNDNSWYDAKLAEQKRRAQEAKAPSQQ